MAIASFTKRFDRPDERRKFKAHGYVDVLTFEGGTTIGRGVFEPGWKWSNDVKPIAGTESCESSHVGYCIRGAMTVRMNTGEEFHVKAGDAVRIPPGHDAWVEGNEPCELIDVSGYREYAVEKAPEKKTA